MCLRMANHSKHRIKTAVTVLTTGRERVSKVPEPYTLSRSTNTQGPMKFSRMGEARNPFVARSVECLTGVECRGNCFTRVECRGNGLPRVECRFRGGLVFKAHIWLYYSTLGSRVITKKKKRELNAGDYPPQQQKKKK